jgi:pyridoxal phosphate enzyme (YggS family)
VTVDVAARHAEVRARIAAAGGDADRITVVAVTKTFGPDAVRAAVEAGLVDCGESRAQELLGKAPEVEGARWHFVGRLQTNKIRQLAGLVTVWQSVDRQEVLDEIARRAPGARVLVQVNVSGESQKGGCEPAATAGLVARACDAGLDVAGLMCVPAADAPREGFRLLRSLADDLGLEERSMGMSGDLEVAVEEGSTMVRVGTALFGPRPPV